MASFVDSRGNTINLSRELARGGEGAVYDIQGDSDHVAKLYFKDVTAEKAKKLYLMPGMASKELLTFSSWPTEVLFDKKGGKLKGFVMPRIKGREIHDLYSPASRKQHYPDADWRFLIHVARNLAAAVDTIHSHGHVIGDLNQKGILLVKDGTVKLIDCDSFQVQHNGAQFLCDVGVRDFTPPELQDKSFQGIVRTKNHDNFGLAVLCFQLLFMGRHPFVGRYNKHGDVPLEKAIKEFFFVYGNSALSKNLQPPPNTLALTAASTSVVQLFEKAFSKESTQNNGRPSAIEWVKTLDRLVSELFVCGQNNLHKYHKSLSKCPWCSLEVAVGPIFIGVGEPSIDLGKGPFDANLIWQKVLSIPSPGPSNVPTFNFGNIVGSPLPRSVSFAKYKRYGLRTLSVGLTGLLLFNINVSGGIWLFIIIGLFMLNKYAFNHQFDDGGETLRRKNAFSDAKNRWDGLVDQWNKEASEAPYQTKLTSLKAMKTEYEGLPKAYDAEKRKLESNREAIQKKHFLEKFFIDKGDIKGIGPSLKKVLASYGIETANDLSKSTLSRVPNFGPVRIGELMGWKKKMEARFKFDPNKGVDPADIAALNNKFKILKKQIEEDLAKGVNELQAVRNNTLRQRTELTAHLENVGKNLAQAQADFSLL